MQSILRSALVLLGACLFISAVCAAPAPGGGGYYDDHHAHKPKPKKHPCNCTVTHAQIDIPNVPNNNLTVPAGVKPEYIALGTGVQNYTCSSTGTYTSIGAVAQLFDIGCLYGKPVFPHIQDIVFNHKGNPKTLLTAILERPAVFLGEHTFITNPITGTGISPLFDFRVGLLKGDEEAFVVGAKIGDDLAPNPAADIDWLELSEVQGELAKNVFRMDTKGGQPPKSCTPGSPPISVKYAAKYWFFNPPS